MTARGDIHTLNVAFNAIKLQFGVMIGRLLLILRGLNEFLTKRLIIITANSQVA